MQKEELELLLLEETLRVQDQILIVDVETVTLVIQQSKLSSNQQKLSGHLSWSDEVTALIKV